MSLDRKTVEGLRPEQMRVRHPYRSKMFEDRLRWLLDNEPQGTLNRFRQSPEGLAKDVLQTMSVAALARLRAEVLHGVKDQADLNEIENLVLCPRECPALSPDPPELLDEEEEAPIWDWLEEKKEEDAW